MTELRKMGFIVIANLVELKVIRSTLPRNLGRDADFIIGSTQRLTDQKPTEENGNWNTRTKFGFTREIRDIGFV